MCRKVRESRVLMSQGRKDEWISQLQSPEENIDSFALIGSVLASHTGNALNLSAHITVYLLQKCLQTNSEIMT